jgi:aspartyl-tRNA synthetase
MDTMNGLKRTHYCGVLRETDTGSDVTVCGWAARQRDLGSLIFIDLRDRTGIVQLAFDDDTKRDVFEKAFTVRSEFVLMARGTVRERSSKNKEIPTGNIEIAVTDLRILSVSETPPFEIIDDCNTAEAQRLKYRYLDLRRPKLMNNILMRNKITKSARDYFAENGFVEIETPILAKPTPEGARDFLVPSRLHNGNFYALPQSPQLYKQLSMVAGFDRYIQFARCFRDEDSRADRQPEFTQIDMEMSFVDTEDVMQMGEGLIKRVFSDVLDIDITEPIPRMKYRDALLNYGSDKPDTRYEMKLIDLTDTVKGCGFGVFDGAVDGGGCVRAICAKQAVKTLSRKEIDKLTEEAKGIGAKGLAYMRLTDDGVSASFAKFVSQDVLDSVIGKCDAQTGDVILIIADTNNSHVLSILGYLRTAVAAKLGIIPEGKYNLLWIVDFPFFDYDEELGEYVAMHHPFTAVKEECIPYLKTDKANVIAKCYDLVLNGFELCSGSIRITDPELQSEIFDLLGMSKEEAYSKFGYLLDAFKYGAPPHGGLGLGLDRLTMTMLRTDSLRDVIAYPKLKDATEAMTGAPSEVDAVQLDDLGVKIK